MMERGSPCLNGKQAHTLPMSGPCLSCSLSIGTSESPTNQYAPSSRRAIQAKLTDQLVTAIDRHERAAARLASQVLILNVVLGVFTIAGTVLTIVSILR